MRKYDDEFKRQAVQKVLDGQPAAAVARELGVNESLLHKWKKRLLTQGDATATAAEWGDTQVLKKRIRELEMENEILKKAALIFGRGS